MIYSIHEGKQADEYRARKAKEAEDKKESWRKRDNERYDYNKNRHKASMGYLKDVVKKNPNGVADGDTINRITAKTEKNSSRNATAWNRTVENERNRRFSYDPVTDKASDGGLSGNNLKYAHDAANRHRRRHNESTIFESVELI